MYEDLTKLTTSDYRRAFEGMRSKNPGRYEYDLADLICNKADYGNARKLTLAMPDFMKDWLERADLLPNQGRN